VGKREGGREGGRVRERRAMLAIRGEDSTEGGATPESRQHDT
jgi:hypothetical protein